MIDLTPFCSDAPNRDYAHQPWSRDGRTYATDGRILISVPHRAEVPDHPKAPAAATAMFDSQRAGELAPLPPLPDDPLTKVCGFCEGRGAGWCSNCDGTGEESVTVGVPVGTRRCNLFYLRLIAVLPGLRVQMDGGATEPMYFTFDEAGEGLLCPLLNQPDPADAPVAPPVRGQDNPPEDLGGELLTTVREAVLYLVSRITTDAAAYHVFGFGSESFSRLKAATAVLRGVPVKQVQEEILSRRK